MQRFTHGQIRSRPKISRTGYGPTTQRCRRTLQSRCDQSGCSPPTAGSRAPTACSQGDGSARSAPRRGRRRDPPFGKHPRFRPPCAASGSMLGQVLPREPVLRASRMGGIMHGGKFDMLLTPWYSGIDPDNSSQFICANVPPHGYNDMRYCSAAMDAAQGSRTDALPQANESPPMQRSKASSSPRQSPTLFWWQRRLEPVSVDFKGFAPIP